MNIDPYLTTIETVAAPILDSYRLVLIDIDGGSGLPRRGSALFRRFSRRPLQLIQYRIILISHYIIIIARAAL